jgi:hypothetical protein
VEKTKFFKKAKNVFLKRKWKKNKFLFAWKTPDPSIDLCLPNF